MSDEAPVDRWNTPEELQAEFNATVAVVYAMFGIFMFDWARSFWKFELRMFVHRQSFQAPIVLYYINRLVASLFLVMTIVSYAGYTGQASSMSSVSCDRIVQAILGLAIIQASLSSFVLAHRCMALYGMKLWVCSLLTVLILAQVSLAIPVITTVPWNKDYPKGAEHCGAALVIADKSHIYCGINYLVTAVVDITILVLTVSKLARTSNNDQRSGVSISGVWSMMSAQTETLGSQSIIRLLFQQSTMAVLLTLLFNLPVMILEFVHINGQAVFIPYNIAVPANAIISCHIIMSLYNWNRPAMKRGVLESTLGGGTSSATRKSGFHNSNNFSDNKSNIDHSHLEHGYPLQDRQHKAASKASTENSQVRLFDNDYGNGIHKTSEYNVRHQEV